MPILFFLDAEYRQSKSDADCAAANRAAASIRFGQAWRGNPGTASKKPRMNSSQSCYGVIIGLSSKENGGGVTVSAIGLKRLAMEKRREERILITRLARVGRRTGIVRNISTSGAFFETDVEYVQGSEIILAIELGGPAEKKLILRCRGTVMRMEHRDGIVGIGVKIVASQVRVSIQESQLIQ